MAKSSEIPLESWNRKQQYEFFKKYAIPFFKITANIDVTVLHAHAKEHKTSFSLSTLHILLKTANKIPEFRLRIENDKVRNYHKINGGVTVLKDDNNFIFCSVDYHDDISIFISEAEKAIKRQKISGKFMPHSSPDIIYFSVIPWVSFTSFQHAREKEGNDSIPRIVWGKFYKENNRLKMPVSVEVHHALLTDTMWENTLIIYKKPLTV